MKKQWLSGGAVLLLSIQAIAQQGNTLDSIIIRENRVQLPYSSQNRNVQVLDKKQIAALPVKSTNELLSYVAGVDLRQRGPNGTQADIAIDGSTFDQVLVLVNGMKMSDPQTGHHMMNLPIPLTAIDHIEVLRGPAAMVYGVNALTGAVNIITKTPVKNDVSAQLYAASSLTTDSSMGDTYYGWGAQATASIAGKKAGGHLLSVSHDEGNGYRYNTAYNSYKAFYQNQFVLNAHHKLEASAGYIKNSFGANGYYSAPADANSTETVETALASIAYTYTPNSKLTIRPRVSYRYNHDDYIFVKQNPELYHNIHETGVLTGEVQGTLKLNHGILGAGLEYRNDRITSARLGNRSRENMGIYAEYKHQFNHLLSAGAGVYGNYNTDYSFQVFPGVNAGYTFLPKWKLFANATMGQRLPTYTDLYYVGPTNIGNPNLRPETAKYAEGGIQSQQNGLWLQASYFYRHTDDFIDWVRTDASSPWQPQNFQSINVQGLTASARYDLSGHIGLSKAHNIMLYGNYTYLDPQIRTPNAETSKYAIEALRHQATVSVQTLWWRRLQLNMNYRYLYRISANDYTLLDARIGYNLGKWNIYADVNNLLDTQYKEIGSVPMPGRWYTLGIRFNAGW